MRNVLLQSKISVRIICPNHVEKNFLTKNHCKTVNEKLETSQNLLNFRQGVVEKSYFPVGELIRIKQDVLVFRVHLALK